MPKGAEPVRLTAGGRPSDQDSNSDDKETPYETAALHKNLRFFYQAAKHTDCIPALSFTAVTKILC